MLFTVFAIQAPSGKEILNCFCEKNDYMYQYIWNRHDTPDSKYLLIIHNKFKLIFSKIIYPQIVKTDKSFMFLRHYRFLNTSLITVGYHVRSQYVFNFF